MKPVSPAKLCELKCQCYRLFVCLFTRLHPCLRVEHGNMESFCLVTAIASECAVIMRGPSTG